MLAALLDLVLPPRCAGCGEPGSAVCRACTAELLREPAPRPPDPRPPGLPECWSATVYDGAARRIILACKEQGRTALIPALGAGLAEVVAAALEAWARRGRWDGAQTRLPQSGRMARARWGRGPIVLVPVPSAPAASRKRGHDPVRAIAAAAAERLRGLGLPIVSVPLLRQARRVADQAGLSSSRRAANLAGAFEAVPRRTGLLAEVRKRRAVVVLVDDIVTTGSTLAEAARALQLTGAEVPLAVTVAATRRRAATRRGSTLASCDRE